MSIFVTAFFLKKLIENLKFCVREKLIRFSLHSFLLPGMNFSKQASIPWPTLALKSPIMML